MKTLVAAFCLLGLLFAPAAFAAEKANTVLIHPGEDIYVQFTIADRSLTVLKVSREPNAAAQLVLHMAAFDRAQSLQLLRLESRFKKTLNYQAEMRLLARNRRMGTSMIPITAGSESFESWPHPIDELALYGFELRD